MAEPVFRRLCIIGIGLIGSSVARLAQAQGDIAATVVVTDANADHLARARELAFADVVEPDAAKAVEGCDAVMLSVPVGAIGAVMQAIAPHLAPGCIVTDSGSTKGSVIRDIAPHLPAGVHLVPGHPMAGTEFSGPDAGFADLFRGRFCILTPPEGADPAAVARVTEFWRRAGSTVETMDVATHDKVVAIVSHLPHLIAFTICSTADDLAQETREAVLKFAASGFRDFTRIAASDPSVWRDILISNREELVTQSRHFLRALHQLETAMKDGNPDALEALIEQASEARAHWRMSSIKSKG